MAKARTKKSSVTDEKTRPPKSSAAGDKELKNLQKEVSQLRDKLSAVENEKVKLQEKYDGLENHYSSLISVFVATNQLHSSLEYVDVFGHIKEIINNLVGSEAYGIYLMNKKNNKVSLVTSEGLDASSSGICMRMAALTITSGELVHTAPSEIKKNPSKVAVCIPLCIPKVSGETMGAIVVYRLLPHKKEFGAQDFAIFKLLGENASTAIYGAKLYLMTDNERKSGLRNDSFDLMPPTLRFK